MIMNNDMQVIIDKHSLTFWHPKASETFQTGAGESIAIGGQLRKFCRQAGIVSNRAALFMAEDLLFYKFLELPLKTPDIREAVGFQLGMITPFEEDGFLYRFETSRKKDGYTVHLYAAKREPLEGYLQDLVGAGFQVTGLFPEHQRYLNRDTRRRRWALVLPGRFTKVLTFDGRRLETRLLSNINPDYQRLAEVCGTGVIYHPQPPSGQFREAGLLTAGEPVLKEFNMLPASYRRPDYMRMAIAALVIINFAGLLGLAGAKVHQLQGMEMKVEAQISALAPRVEEFNQLQSREQQLREDGKRIEEVGKNPDLITFLHRLTQTLPSNSHLAQMRKDPAGNAISMQGYTQDIADLTASLQSLGEAKLKSTSRRQNQTYFDVEVNVP
jgi:Tfp pilus assembly protein PilN